MKKIIGIGALVILMAGGLFWYFDKPLPFIADNDLEEITESNSPELPNLVLRSAPITLTDKPAFNLQIPEGYAITPAAQGMKRIRFMAKSPDGRLFLTDMYNLEDNTKGKIYILSDFDEATHTFKKSVTYLSDLRNPNSLTFYTEPNGTHWLYLALTDKLVRYKFTPGEEAPTSESETLATFPAYGLGYKYGGWHLTRTVAIHKNKVYVSVGSSCNSCEEKESEPSRATIMEMNFDGSNQKIYASGLRNAVGIKWVGNELFATAMGSDHLGDEKPNDLMHQIAEGAHYGWPYCFEAWRTMYADTSQSWRQKKINCNDVPLSYAVFDAHSAPLGLEYFGLKNTVPELKNTFLVALHGSGETRIKAGYSIVRITKTGGNEEFIDGFLQNGKRVGRPVDILQHDAKSFFFTDDFAGVVYYVYKP